MSLSLAATVGKKVATSIVKKFGGAVIERWTRHRAERFFEGFVETVGLPENMENQEVDKRLTEILADDTKSEVLFDSYRRVCFSKSKTLGPRIIGLLTGLLVYEGRMASHSEENIFAAAELLSDGDFIEFMKSYHEHREKAKGDTGPEAKHRKLGGSIIIRWLEESSDTSSMTGRDLDIGSFPWQDAFGRWAVYLERCGLMEDRIQQTTKRHPHSDGDDNIISTHVITTITFCLGCDQLYELIVNSVGAEPPAGS